MIQLEPGEKFIIAQQLNDPSDSNTYYVRSFVRNAETDELLATINLTDRGDQRFRGSFYVPVNKAPSGLFITITTKTYTNALYTIESTTYGRIEDVYLVQQRWQRNLGNFGGGDLTPSQVRKIIGEELKNLPKSENIDTKFILKEIETIIKGIEFPKYQFPEIKMPEMPKATDIEPILRELKRIVQTLSLLKNTDITPILEAIDNKELNVADVMNGIDNILKQSEKLAKKIMVIEDNTKKPIVPKISETETMIKKRRESFFGNIEFKKQRNFV